MVYANVLYSGDFKVKSLVIDVISFSLKFARQLSEITDIVLYSNTNIGALHVCGKYRRVRIS